MLSAFREYETYRSRILVDHSIVGIPVGTRLRRIVRQPDGWIIWMATNDFIHGTFLAVYNDGQINRVTIREDEGPEVFRIRPSDDEIANR